MQPRDTQLVRPTTCPHGLDVTRGPHVRQQVGGFDSVEDLGALMALHPRVVEALRTRAVALPD